MAIVWDTTNETSLEPRVAYGAPLLRPSAARSDSGDAKEENLFPPNLLVVSLF